MQSHKQHQYRQQLDQQLDQQPGGRLQREEQRLQNELQQLDQRQKNGNMFLELDISLVQHQELQQLKRHHADNGKHLSNSISNP